MILSGSMTTSFFFPIRLGVGQIENAEHRENETRQDHEAQHMTTYLYCPGHPLASKSGCYGSSR
jgi:hypothetical protein